ncbi:hypothetical protein PG985_003749, partial [Apiospora marii]|uniref:uncharacterized protein n=1 Tax=Apiospora marii TaxID=335849 RepID=UPI00312EE99C
MNMFRSVLALLCLLQFVHGQQPMPLCASKCLETHLKQSSCSATDFPCICADEQLQANVGTCMLGSCTLVESLAAMNVTKTICKEPIRDNSTTTPVVTAISAALAVIFVAIRVLNNHLRGSLNIADWCAVLALVSSIPMDVSEFYSMDSLSTDVRNIQVVANGFGKDIWTLDQPRINNVVLVSDWPFPLQKGYTTSPKRSSRLTFHVLSPVDLDQRIHLRPRHRPHQNLHPLLLPARVPLAGVPVRLLRHHRLRGGLQPRHLHRHHLQLLARRLRLQGLGRRLQGTCININAFWFSQATINITTDLWIMVLPITQIKKLDLERKKKIFLCIMFCVGLLVTVFSIIRFTGLVSYSSTTNPTYNNVGAATWSVLECNVGIVCCCMPYVRSLLNRVFPNCFGGTFFSSGGKRGQKYHTMTSTTAAASGKADGGDGTSKLQSQTTNATATTDGGGVDDGRKCGSRVSRGGGAENTRGTADRSDTIELAPMEGTLARYPE